MVRFGLLPPVQRYWVDRLVTARSSFIFHHAVFGNSPQLHMASINRDLEEYYDMAKQARKAIASNTKSLPEFSWKGFIDVKLTEDQKQSYAAWDLADADVWDGVATYCEAGIKIALTYNSKNASFTCSGTGQPASGSNNGWCVNAYAKTPYEAARVWLFKVSAILPDDWSTYEAPSSDDIG
jgi:hypothetical protein